VNTEQALLLALHCDPCDVVTWSALADCLEEKGEGERAELLRLSRLPPASKKARAAAEKRVRELLAAGVVPCVPVLENSLGMRLALIPAGKFRMGSPKREAGRGEDEGPRHEVEITRPFYLGVFPVTQQQFHTVTRRNPSHFRCSGEGKTTARGTGSANFPVGGVSWEDAAAFCKSLSGMPAERKESRLYVLPSEAQWEYACRGGASSTPFHCGASLSSTQANFDGIYPYGRAPKGADLGRPTPVGSYPPNAFGLFDMHGNVWEWCADWYQADYYARSPRKDPPGPTTGELRVMRGGSWPNCAAVSRSAFRYRGKPGVGEGDVGLRVACLLP
jgi:uncharacterized protein (TIGR02996 family)